VGLNDAWLALVEEEALEPDLAICDAHHHLWGKREHRSAPRYMLEDFLADIDKSPKDGGHNIVSTVFVDSNAMYRARGSRPMKPVGEVEFANGVAAMSRSGLYGKTRVAAAIVGHADMRLGAKVGPVLDAMIDAAPDRFKGIRHCTTFDADDALPKHRDAPVPGLLLDENFRAGIAELSSRGLIFEAWLWHPQLPELTDLARAFPELTIIVNHCGGPLGIGAYKGRRDEVTMLWRKSLSELAKCENVFVKLGGVNMVINGHDWHRREKPPTSDELVAAAGQYIEFSIEAFGADRGMFESNYPAERITCGYGVVWNFFKKVTQYFSADEKAKLYHDTAARIYGLTPPN
jgi:predicted TIM-barrel fold metal-dependent hydrolase